MEPDAATADLEKDLIARLDRLRVWPYSGTVLWIVGIGYLIAFFDISNVSFGIPVFSKVLHFTPGQEAYPITASLLGYIVGAWLSSNFADAVGRKVGIMSATLLFTFGCIVTTFAFSLASMVIGRFITGMGIGAEIAVISAYIGELAPAAVRGRYTSMANVFAMLGQGVVPLVALGLVPNFAWGWRAMFLIGALGGLTLFAFPWLPESPRWLLSKRRHAEAAAVIETAERRAMERTGGRLPPPIEVAAEVHVQGFPVLALFQRRFIGRVALLFAMWFVWYAGSYTWLGLGPTFFVDHGYTLTRSILFIAASSLGYPLGSLLATALGDAFERKFSILAGVVVWAACFVVIGFTRSEVSIYIAIFVLAASLGTYLPLMYTLTAESFPTRARATGVALTDGTGHLGGALGPILALSVYAWGGIGSGFSTVFLFMAMTGVVTALLLPFTITATRKSLEVVTEQEAESAAAALTATAGGRP